MYRLAVLVSGGGSNLQAIIDKVHKRVAGIEIVLVVSNVARRVLALERAQLAGIPTAVFPLGAYPSHDERDQAMAEAVIAAETDLVVLAGYMAILHPPFLSHFPHGVINLHPALLPSFAGADGIGDALDYGVKVTGVTVHFVDEGMDSGPVIQQQHVIVRDDDTHDSLAERIHAVEHQLLPRTIELLARGKVLPPKPGSRLVLVDRSEPSEIA